MRKTKDKHESQTKNIAEKSTSSEGQKNRLEVSTEMKPSDKVFLNVLFRSLRTAVCGDRTQAPQKRIIAVQEDSCLSFFLLLTTQHSSLYFGFLDIIHINLILSLRIPLNFSKSKFLFSGFQKWINVQYIACICAGRDNGRYERSGRKKEIPCFEVKQKLLGIRMLI